MEPAIGGGEEVEDYVLRKTLCLPEISKDTVLHYGDDGFDGILRKYFLSPESIASERLVHLKSKLRTASTYDFWGILMEGMCDILGAECAFVAKRILVDDDKTAVEMPPLGEPGSCLLGVAFYLTDGKDAKNMHRNYRYHAYGSPCAYMKHEKVFIIPERMSEFIRDNPNTFPWKQSEAYIGLPLFHDGKCFAHFGNIWALEGASRRQLSWNFIEMLLHSLEDIVLQRILEGRGFAKGLAASQSTPARIIPIDAITASQSLKPYARSLSHELRTPMQGVVGMLDIMRFSVIDAMQSQTTKAGKAIFEELKSNIEVVQESSKRAVQAADNVVHAYDLNMQMPETPLVADAETVGDESLVTSSVRERQLSDILIVGSGISSSSTGPKRARSEELDFHPGPPLKRLTTMAEVGLRGSCTVPSPAMEVTTTGVCEAMHRDLTAHRGRWKGSSVNEANSRASSECGGSPSRSPIRLDQTEHQIWIRQFLVDLVDDAIRHVHPVSKNCTQTELGEMITIRTEGPRGQERNLTINLVTETDVPETIPAQEQHLQFALQKVVDNAIKFTENGTIRVTVKLARNGQLVEIRVNDTGCGITEESKAYLFNPHFQEDASISRSKDGLGLSLFNAKAHVRRNLRGDLTLERSATEGPSKGSEFLIRFPSSALSDRGRADTSRMGTPILHALSHQSSPQLAAISIPATPLSAPTLAPTSVPISTAPSVPTSVHSDVFAPRWRTPSIDSGPPVLKGSNRSGFNSNLAKDIPLTFLIAEDNAINRQILVGYLKKLGYNQDNIILAFDGIEAVQRYEMSLSQQPEKRIDAILMDLWMPNMDGYEATEKILKLANERGEFPAIMAVTADITGPSLERAKQTGMKGFISKPYRVWDIEHLILQHFYKHSLSG